LWSYKHDLFGSHLDTLATALRDQHYAASTIRTHLREARAFGAWLTGQFYPLHDCSELLAFPVHRRNFGR